MTLLVPALFTKSSGQPATAEALTDIAIYLYSRNKSTGAVATVWNGVNPTEEVGGGIYTRAYASDAPTTYDYFAYAVYSGATVMDSNYALYGGEGGATPEEVWANGTRTLTQTAAEVTAILSGSTLTIHRGDTATISFTSLGDISGRTKLWFTIKAGAGDADTAALIEIEETAGLVYINGTAATTAANGSITVTDANAGDLTVVIAAAETAKLVAQSGLVYDVQVLATTVSTLTSGSAVVSADVTRATS